LPSTLDRLERAGYTPREYHHSGYSGADLAIETDFVIAPSAPEAAGEVIVFDVEGVAVALVEIGSKLHAFDDTCSHRARPLSEGEFEGPIVRCPCHRSHFDIRTGRS
jgi:nitrite reductase/ring-hydroxylating ferredoxin subunit